MLVKRTINMDTAHPTTHLSSFSGKSRRAPLALADLLAAIKAWPLWTTLGWNDILQRYRRSLLGPFWLTASMGIMVLALGVVYGRLFKTDLHDFLPYLSVGLIVWGYISSAVSEAGTLFTGSESYIKQIRLPFCLYVFRFMWSRIVIFAHNLVIYAIVLVTFQIWPGGAILAALPGFAVLTINLASLSLLIGMLSARFRDIPQIISSLVQLSFFITPVMWKADLLGPGSLIVMLNPFYHLLELVRAPLLGNAPSVQTALAAAIITLTNLSVSTRFFVMFRHRISYWI